MASMECHTPQLPVELLEAISNLLGPNDILSFRLACRTFADISIDNFTDWYMRETYCFFPDPARVQRLASITSQPHLATRMRAVFLTLNAFEYNDDELSWIAPAHDRGDTLPEYKKAYQTQELEYHCAQRPSLDLLSQSLERLNSMRCRLQLDLGNRRLFGDHTEWARISQRVLAAIERALYPICDLIILSARDDEQRCLSGGVRAIENAHDELYCTPFHSTRLDDPVLETVVDCTYEQSLEAMRQAVAIPEDSESLDIIYWHWPSYTSPEVSFANDVLSANSWTRLKRLTFVLVILPTFENLFQVLRRCKDTLGVIMLNSIEVISVDSHEWKSLFETLSGLPKLEHLLIQGLWWRRDNQQRRLGLVEVESHLVLRCQESGNSSIKAALTEILKKGLMARKGSERIKLW